MGIHKVWIWWHADDGFMLERYSESDELLTEIPSEKIGDSETNSNVESQPEGEGS